MFLTKIYENNTQIGRRRRVIRALKAEKVFAETICIGKAFQSETTRD